MGDIITFRARAVAPHVPPALSPAETRRVIEEAAQAALDTADSLLAILDRMDGDADAEDGGDAEPALAAPENHHDSQIGWLRGNGGDREAEAAEILLPVVRISPVPRCRPLALAPEPLGWCGHGNIVAAAGVALLDLVAGGGR